MIATYRYIKRKRAEKKNPQLRAASANKAKTDRATWIWRIQLAVALAIPIFFETLDYTVVATAQTSIASFFSRLDLQSYIGTAYVLTSTVFLPIFASVSDIFGRHFALQLSLIFFLFGSVLSTAAQNMETMLVGRGIAGIGAAGLLAVVRIIIADSSSLDDNNWQVAMLFILYAIGYSVGPVIGGFLTAVSFRWIFAINLPATVLGMILAFFFLRKKTKAGQPPKHLPVGYKEQETLFSKALRVDWIGTIVFVGAGILILLALNWGSTEEWRSAKVIVSFVIGGLLFIAFVFWEYILMQHELQNTSSSKLFWAEPMIPLQLFRNYDTCALQVISFVGGMIMLTMMYFIAIFMTIVSGLSAQRAGVQLVYFAPGMGGGTLIGVFIISKTRQPRYAIILGSLVIPIALGLVSMGMNESNQGLVNGFMVMAGVGSGLTIGTVNVQARFTQGKEHVAVISALILFFRALGGTVGLAQCGAVLNARVSRFIRHAFESGALSATDAASLVSVAGAIDSLQAINNLPPNLQTIVRDAFRDGVRWSFISIIPWAAIAFLMSLALSRIPDSNRSPAPDETAEMTTLENPQTQTQSREPVQKPDNGSDVQRR
ncbi:hypothetical protein D9758_001993 [Tetrapyrgos nigripes]|uniref:Major facilitator superfamily (MFS) profile domain-containing protein n=1 Tax=Tetrapyrgos nigripes TaxID=182062 RepID=A0A8H5GU19_9AGAR|nr:hypothetical protein D9758_001993 [Tetrapyrgos nigripes]